MNMKNRNVTYSTVGDYQLPNLTLSQPKIPLGKYGRMRRNYLKQHHPVLYNSMLLNGTLYPHLLELSKPVEESRKKGKLTAQERAAHIAQLEKAMKEAASRLEFELAAALRDQIIELKGQS